MEDFPEAFESAIEQLGEIESSGSKHLIVITDGIVNNSEDIEPLVNLLTENVLEEKGMRVHIIAFCPTSEDVFDKWKDLENDQVKIYLAASDYTNQITEYRSLWTTKIQQTLQGILEQTLEQSMRPSSNNQHYERTESYGWLNTELEVEIPGFMRDLEIFVVSLEQKRSSNTEQIPQPIVLSPNGDALDVKRMNNLWEFSRVGENGLTPLSQCQARTWVLRSSLRTPTYYFYEYIPLNFSSVESYLQLFNKDGVELQGEYHLEDSEPLELEILSVLAVDNFSETDYTAFDDCFSMFVTAIDSSGSVIYTTPTEPIAEQRGWMVNLNRQSGSGDITFSLRIELLDRDDYPDPGSFTVEEKLSITYIPTLKGEIRYFCPTSTCTDDNDDSADSFELSIDVNWRGDHQKPLVTFIPEGGNSDCHAEIQLNKDDDRILDFKPGFNAARLTSEYTNTISRKVGSSPNIFALFLNDCGFFRVEWPGLDLPSFECRLPADKSLLTSAKLILECTLKEKN